jgi:regulatory protein
MENLEQGSIPEVPDSRPINLRNIALGLLARREHSRHELQQKLLQKLPIDGDRETIAALLDKLTEQRLLSDERFTEAYVSMRARKGYGPTRIAMELAERGVDSELAQSFLDQRNDWDALLAQTWEKKFNSRPANYPEKARQMRFLHFRGYDTEAIQRLFDGL